jgi:DNA polymerase-3 subunit epsilon
MEMLSKLSLRTRIFLIFAGLAAGAVAALIVGLWLAHRRLGSSDTIDAFIQVGVISGFLTVGLITLVWYLFDLNVAKPIDVLAGALRARTHADVAGSLDAAVARYLGDLAPAATAAAVTLRETRSALAEAVARETLRLGQEKARLETLLSDVPVGVLLCAGDGQIAFYNASAGEALATSAGVGLDRNITDYLRAGPLRLAYERLIKAGDADAASDLICTTTDGARVMSARMRLLSDGSDDRPGYVLTLRDVTSDLAARSRTDALLAEIFDRIRRPTGNISMLMAALPETGEPVDAALRTEVASLSAAVTDLAERHDTQRLLGWQMAMTRASDLLDALKARLAVAGIEVETETAPLLLRCNGFDILALLAGLGIRLAETTRGKKIRITVREEENGAVIRLTWDGEHLPFGLLEQWLAESADPERPQLRRADVIAAHATDIWPERHDGNRAGLCLPIREARREVGRPPPITRKVVYDFDLLSQSRGAKVADTRLDNLTCVVFDTETTGLLPLQGDEIVQIAAVRIVNGRQVKGEVFDSLVNPGRSIPMSSTEVHGITDAMVSHAPDVDTVLRRFHEFARGAVLVAHNAPFDMEFLRRHEKRIGLQFDNPVLDTVLLSAVVFGQHASHSLDALTDRLGITIPEEARHTAIGDTRATAEAFLKLLQMLKGRHFATFGEVLAEVRRHGRLLADLNTEELIGTELLPDPWTDFRVG